MPQTTSTGKPPPRTLETNEQVVVQEAKRLQAETKAALARVRSQASETQELGATSLQELYEQRLQLQQIEAHGDRAQAQLQRAEQLQNRLSWWSLQFNGRAARRAAQAVQDHEQARQKLYDKRRERDAASAPASLRGDRREEEAVVITPHGRGKKKKRQQRNSSNDANSVKRDEEASQKGLLLGTAAAEASPELQQLAAEDAEIDGELQAVGDQLDELLDMAQTLGSEVKTQSRGVDDFSSQLQDLVHQQRVVNHRTGRFLTGRPRRQYEQSSATHATGFW